MDTPPIDPTGKWSDLTARARNSPPPEIDVRLAVRRAMEASTAGTAPLPAAPAGGFAWLSATLAALAAIACAAAYAGLEAVPELTVALGFGSLF